MEAVILDKELLSDFENMLDPVRKLSGMQRHQRWRLIMAIQQDTLLDVHSPTYCTQGYPSSGVRLSYSSGDAPLPLSTPFGLHRPFYRGVVVV